MKYLRVMQQLKKDVETVTCPACTFYLRFKSAHYNDYIMENGGDIKIAVYCRPCNRDGIIIVNIDPVNWD